MPTSSDEHDREQPRRFRIHRSVSRPCFKWFDIAMAVATRARMTARCSDRPRMAALRRSPLVRGLGVLHRALGRSSFAGGSLEVSGGDLGCSQCPGPLGCSGAGSALGPAFGGAVEFRVLGPLEVVSDTGVVKVSGAKCRALLAMLLVRAGTVVTADRLIDDLWHAGPPGSALATLQSYVYQLRKCLPPGSLQTRAAGYLLEVSPHEVDAVRFEGALAERFASRRTCTAVGRGPTDRCARVVARTGVGRLRERTVGARGGGSTERSAPRRDRTSQ